MPGHTALPHGPAGTIYEKEKGFDDILRIEMDPTKTKFIKELKSSEASLILQVQYDGKPCVLKVVSVFDTCHIPQTYQVLMYHVQFHNNKDAGYAEDGIRDLNRARCEIRAYCSLKRFGICDAGFVPYFYGYSLSLDTEAFAPHLNIFLCDLHPPSSILIEYLPNPAPMNCVTYTKERMAKAIDGIQQVHSALVEHNDPYPKNIMIVPGNVERVVWIDFDVAITYPDSTYIRDRERGWLEMETSRVEDFGVKLVCTLTSLQLTLCH
ncbi:hypothetical protein PRK78_002759 [Emydomyces testavorans]|uniref:Protein kinase domain-containing protein n=1 Tax=Emydomyces testavorans TaxID=2070801 RepID=A0AAF0DEW7_9EURO|nr:hypothetical protein PRK78_002759 [Emydomyces testavorans]